MIHWSDIGDKFIHIHRQQLKSTDESGKEIFYEVGYTKDERTHPHGGRFFPITDEIRFVLELAKKLPGKKSDYVFHDKEGKAPSKDSYAYIIFAVAARSTISLQQTIMLSEWR